ncbi:MAG: trehalase family glycosidase [Spirosomataceae bacterium]
MAHKLKGQQTKAAILEQKATERQKAIKKYGWNESLGFYFDYEWKANHYKEIILWRRFFPYFLR